MENGVDPRGRDVVKSRLDRIQQADADVKLASLRNRLGIRGLAPQRASTGGRTATSGAASPGPADTSVGGDGLQLAEIEAEIARLRQENAGLVAANQTLAQEKATLAESVVRSAPMSGADAADEAYVDTVMTNLAEVPMTGAEAQNAVRQAVVLLQRLTDDNRKLNAEVKRATLELGSLGRRLRLAEQGRSAGGSADAAPAVNAATETALTEACSTIAGLEADLTRSNQRITGLETALSTLQQQAGSASSLATELEKRNLQIAKFQEQQTRTVAEMAASAAELAQLRVRFEKLSTDLARAEARLAEAPSRTAIDDLGAELEAKETELNGLRARLADANSWSSELKEANGEILNLRQLLELATTERAQFEARLTTVSADAESLRQAVARAEAAERAAQSELQDAQQQVATLGDWLKEANDALTAAGTPNAGNRDQLSRQQSEIAALQTELQTARARRAAAEQQIGVLEASVANKDRAVAALQRELETLNSSATTGVYATAITEARAQIQQLETDLEASRRQTGLLRQSLGAAESQLEEKVALIGTLQSDQNEGTQSLRDQIAAAELELATSSAQLAEARSTIAELRATVTTQGQSSAALVQARQRVQELEQQVTVTQSVLDDRETSMATMREELIAREAEIQEYQSRRTALESQIAALTDRVETLQTDSTQASTQQTALAEAQGQLQSVVADRAALRNRVEALNQALAEQERATVAYQSQAESLTTEVQVATRQLEATETIKSDLTRARAQLDTAQTSLATSAQRIDELTTQLARAQAV